MRIRETMSAIISKNSLPKDRTTDDLHIIYHNGDLILRELYEISRDANREFTIAEAYNKFIKLILEWELDKTSEDRSRKILI